jgi:hypothetical protein
MSSLAIPPMNGELLANLTGIQEKLLALPQIDVQTDHVIHGGMYVRTIRLAPDVVLMGALIKISTVLIVSGRTKVFTGDGWIELAGYHVIPARAGRKQIFVTQEETVITMIFRTEAQTVEQAEEEFTDEAELLMSKNSENDTVTVTGV